MALWGKSRRGSPLGGSTVDRPRPLSIYSSSGRGSSLGYTLSRMFHLEGHLVVLRNDGEMFRNLLPLYSEASSNDVNRLAMMSSKVKRLAMMLTV